MKKRIISKEEFSQLLKALDVFIRIYIGQYENIVDINNPFGASISPEVKESIKEIRGYYIPTLKNRSLYVSLGIWGPDTPKIAVKAYDIYQILRYQDMFNTHPEGGVEVDFNPPYINGMWHIDGRDLTFITNTIKSHNYKDFLHGFRRNWNCPLVVVDFLKDKVVYFSNDEIEDICRRALEVYHLCRNYEYLKVFECVYPDADSSVVGNCLNELSKEVQKKDRA